MDKLTALPANPVAIPGTYAGCLICGDRHDASTREGWLDVNPVQGLGLCDNCAPSLGAAVLRAAFLSTPAAAEQASDILAMARVLHMATPQSAPTISQPELKLERVLSLARRHLALLDGISTEALNPRSRAYKSYSLHLLHLILDTPTPPPVEVETEVL